MGTPSKLDAAALALQLLLFFLLVGPRVAQSVAHFDLTVSLPDSIPFSFPALSKQMFSMSGVATQQLFSLSQLANAFEVVVPASAGQTSVNISSVCVGPLAFLTNAATISPTVSPKSLKISVIDLLNFNRNLTSRTLQVDSLQGDFASQFTFNKAQYLSWDAPAFLVVYCTTLNGNSPPTLTIIAEDAVVAAPFSYPNQFSVIDRDVTFKIAPNRNQTISVPSIGETVFFNFDYTGEDGLLFDIAGNRERLVPGSLLTAELPANNPLTLSIFNNRSTSALVRMRTSLTYSLPGWKIALICVFSIVGGLALIVGALFIYVSYKRSKKEAEYPAPLDNVVDRNELQKRDSPTAPVLMEAKNNSPANDFNYKPLQIQGNLEYPPLPQESGSGSNQPILARSIELDSHRQ
jgi:hypothetical protein